MPRIVAIVPLFGFAAFLTISCIAVGGRRPEHAVELLEDLVLRGVVSEDEAGDGDDDQQQRRQRKDRVVGERRAEARHFVAAEFA